MDIELPELDHLTADFIGEPGQRTFYLQAAMGSEVVTLLMEKFQVASMAELLVELLDRVDTTPATSWDRDAMRLREPVEPRWRVGALSVGVDVDGTRFVVEAAEAVAEDEEREVEHLRVWATRDQIRWLAAHAAWSVEQGRPSCQLCGLPMDAEGHLCPAMNGHGRRD